MTKPQHGYAIKYPEAHEYTDPLVAYSINPTKAAAWASVVHEKCPRERLYRHGYRCVRVEVREVEK